MEINWRPEANKALYGIYRFYAEKNRKVAEQIVSDITQAVDKLSHFPKMAPVEDMLAGLADEFRSMVVYRLFKVVYFINEPANEIVIVTIFDCRQNPAKLRESVLKKSK